MMARMQFVPNPFGDEGRPRNPTGFLWSRRSVLEFRLQATNMLAVTASLLALAVGNHSFRHSKFRFADIMENRKNDLCLDGHSLPTVTESWCRGQVGDDESSLCLGVASILNATCAELLDEEFLQQVARRVGLVNDVRGARIYGAEAKHMRRAATKTKKGKRPELNLSMVAFEGQAKALKDNDRVLNETGGKFFLSVQKRARLTMVREYCDPFTLVRMLQERAVPRGFLFLKIDIDSVDLHVFDVIMREFRPTLVLVERASLRELPPRSRQPLARVGFAALKPANTHAGRVGSEAVRRNSSSTRHRTQWSAVVCQQSDTTMWLSHAPRRGYSVIQGEGKNLIMVPTEYQKHFPPLSCTYVGGLGATAKLNISVPPSFVQHVEEECAADGMEYTLELDGVCCPKHVDGVHVHLGHCRCL